MDGKIINKAEQIQKEPLDERKRDRGDNFKKQEPIRSKISDGINLKAMRKLPLPDQGDVLISNKVKKTQRNVNNTNKIDKVIIDKGKKPNDIKPKLTPDLSSKANIGAEKTSCTKTSEMNAAVNKMKVGERTVNDKLSSKLKTLNNQNQAKVTNKITVKSDLKSDRLKNQTSLKSASRDVLSDSTKPENIKTEADVIKKEKDITVQRKPMIKTVKSKNDNRVYKAVTFTEQKRVKPTVLEINIPNLQTNKTRTHLIDKNLEAKPASVEGTANNSASKLSIKAKSSYNRRNRFTERIKRKKLNRCISSPDKFKKVESPPTEVAKWAPSCLNAHTKPYYEAWVNTTLAAISKISKKDKLYLEKQNIIKTFEKSLELGTESPDLIHENYADEHYTGKIKIKQKNVSKRSRQPLITPLIDINKDYKI